MMDNTGGPAFPTLADNGHAMNQDGMTLRDYFAAKAMVAFWLAPDVEGCIQTPEAIADWSYEMADAMLKARGE